MPNINSDNYYQNRTALDFSIIKSWIHDPVQAYNHWSGLTPDTTSLALQYGGAVHDMLEILVTETPAVALSEQALTELLESFRERYPLLFKKNGELRADTVRLLTVVETFLEKCNEFGLTNNGNVSAEYVLTGNIDGYDMRGKADIVDWDNKILYDYKTFNSAVLNDDHEEISKFHGGSLMPITESRLYSWQMALYTRLLDGNDWIARIIYVDKNPKKLGETFTVEISNHELKQYLKQLMAYVPEVSYYLKNGRPKEIENEVKNMMNDGNDTNVGITHVFVVDGKPLKFDLIAYNNKRYWQAPYKDLTLSIATEFGGTSFNERDIQLLLNGDLAKINADLENEYLVAFATDKFYQGGSKDYLGRYDIVRTFEPTATLL